MSESEQSRVFMFDNNDPAMQRAYSAARETFRYLWREIAWDRRRIIPALGLACVKAPFSDGEPASKAQAPEVEHMWFSDVDFDGQFVSGELANSPNRVKSVKAGDHVRVPLGQISDWMFVLSEAVYGAFTVNLLRSRMGAAERRDHDAAWGLNFGDPHKVRTPADPHPMSANMAPSLREHLVSNPSAVNEPGFNGWTLLHSDASAGSLELVSILLGAGADPNAKSDNGMTPLQLAEVLGWTEVAARLRQSQT